MSDTYDVIPDDGVYTDRFKNSFQFRKGHLLAKGQIAADGLAKTGEFELVTPLDAEKQAAADAEANAKAAQPPENKAAPAPAPAAPAPAPAAKADEKKP